MGKKKKAAAVIGPAAIVAALFLRFGMGLPGFGGGLGLPGRDQGTAPGTQQEQAADAEETASSIAEAEETSAAKEETTAEPETDEMKESVSDAPETEESTEALTEYVIEIRQDKYYLDGVEVTSGKIGTLLEDENAVIRIDNNYGSQKAVSELKELFMRYDVPFVE